MTAHPECPYCGERERLRISCQGMPGWDDPGYICPACFTGTDDGPCFDDLPEVANDNTAAPDPVMGFVMFGRLP